MTARGFDVPSYTPGLSFGSVLRRNICIHDYRYIYIHLYTDMETYGRIHGDADVDTSLDRETDMPIWRQVYRKNHISGCLYISISVSVPLCKYNDRVFKKDF